MRYTYPVVMIGGLPNCKGHLTPEGLVIDFLSPTSGIVIEVGDSVYKKGEFINDRLNNIEQESSGFSMYHGFSRSELNKIREEAKAKATKLLELLE